MCNICVDYIPIIIVVYHPRGIYVGLFLDLPLVPTLYMVALMAIYASVISATGTDS